MTIPTSEAYAELQTAFDHFNATLFDSVLPPCLITLQRERRTYGYFSHGRFVQTASGELVDEIAMNPGFFAVCSIEDTLSTLAHEMAHQWQAHFGKPGRRGYHNKEWGAKMQAIGLMPSHTGREGGRSTGEQMDHYIIEGGAFARACRELITRDYRLSWVDRFPVRLPSQASDAVKGTLTSGEGGHIDAPSSPPGAQWISPDAQPSPGRSNRVKYRCPSCASQAWGKPSLRLLCGEEGCQAQALVPIE